MPKYSPQPSQREPSSASTTHGLMVYLVIIPWYPMISHDKNSVCHRFHWFPTWWVLPSLESWGQGWWDWIWTQQISTSLVANGPSSVIFSPNLQSSPAITRKSFVNCRTNKKNNRSWLKNRSLPSLWTECREDTSCLGVPSNCLRSSSPLDSRWLPRLQIGDGLYMHKLLYWGLFSAGVYHISLL